jgi:hypothetical protein
MLLMTKDHHVHHPSSSGAHEREEAAGGAAAAATSGVAAAAAAGSGAPLTTTVSLERGLRTSSIGSLEELHGGGPSSELLPTAITTPQVAAEAKAAPVVQSKFLPTARRIMQVGRRKGGVGRRTRLCTHTWFGRA